MSDSRQPSDPIGPNLNDIDAGSPTTPAAAHGAEVEGYILIFCNYCSHNHKQSDPKCNIYCAHGAALHTGGVTGGAAGTIY